MGIKDADGNDNEDYLQLTRMLHFKDETANLTLEDYKTVFEKNLPHCAFPDIDLNKSVVEYIFNSADACEDIDEGVNLEHKIVLSIAIRIWAERYMIAKIRDYEADYEVAKK